MSSWTQPNYRMRPMTMTGHHRWPRHNWAITAWAGVSFGSFIEFDSREGILLGFLNSLRENRIFLPFNLLLTCYVNTAFSHIFQPKRCQPSPCYRLTSRRGPPAARKPNAKSRSSPANWRKRWSVPKSRANTLAFVIRAAIKWLGPDRRARRWAISIIPTVSYAARAAGHCAAKRFIMCMGVFTAKKTIWCVFAIRWLPPNCGGHWNDVFLLFLSVFSTRASSKRPRNVLSVDISSWKW